MRYYIVDAFAEKLFTGNPAAVCLIEKDFPAPLMQNIARENNLSETAFVLKLNHGYSLRWFTPGGEIDLCGHATLATAFVILTLIEPEKTSVTFQTKSGLLTVKKTGERFAMDFPSYDLVPQPVSAEIVAALGCTPTEVFLGRDLVCVLDNAQLVHDFVPDLTKIKTLSGLLLHLTALGDHAPYDCVSRSFAPKLNVAEDPVCGSDHCHLAPLWSQKLKKNNLTAYQASVHGGVLQCTVSGNRVTLAGAATLYASGELYL